MIVWCRRGGLGRRGRLGLGGWGCWLLKGEGGRIQRVYVVVDGVADVGE